MVVIGMPAMTSLKNFGRKPLNRSAVGSKASFKLPLPYSTGKGVIAMAPWFYWARA
jgi:hypothetical protein